MLDRICIITLVSLVYFLKTIGYKYTSDDIPVLRASEKLNLKPLRRRFLQIEGTIRVNEQQDHFITMIIHTLICVFIYIAFGATDASYIASFLFCFNPINNQGSVWISGRGYALPTLFVLMAISLPLASPIFVWLAMYFNIGFVGAFVLPFWNIWLIIPVIIMAIHYSGRIKDNVNNKMRKEMFYEDKRIHPIKLVYALKTFGFYLSHSLIPIKNTFYHSLMQSMAGAGKEKAGKIDRFFWVGLISILGIGYKMFFTPWDMVSFGLLWFCIGIAPFLNFFRISQEIAERYTYYPNVGLMLALATIIHTSPVWSAVFITMYATKMWFYMDAYQDEFFLVEQACLNSPDSWFAWHVKALKRWEHKAYREAIIMWTMAKMISPKEFKVLFNLATLLMICRQESEARRYLKLAEENVPKGQEEQVKKLVKDWKKGNYPILV